MSILFHSIKILLSFLKNRLIGDGERAMILGEFPTTIEKNENSVRIHAKKRSRRKRRSLSSIGEPPHSDIDQKLAFTSSRPGGSYLKPYHYSTAPPSHNTALSNLLTGTPSTGLTSSVSSSGLAAFLNQPQQVISLSSIIQIPSEVTQVDFQLVSDKPRIRELLYGKLQNPPFRDHHFSMATDLFSNLQEFQAFIIPCESALGPLWPLHSLAHTIIS